MNIKFNYMYRDASNYKAWGNVAFYNPDGLTLFEINTHLINSFGIDGLFIASQIRIPEVFLYLHGDLTIDDHCFHEFASVEFTSETENDKYGRSIYEFINEIEHQYKIGWLSFDPAEPWIGAKFCNET